MALVIETGAQVPNANSYNTVAELRSYALARGVTLPVADADVEILAIGAMDYLGTYESWFKGQRVSNTQSLSWPREYAYLAGYAAYPGFPDDGIPGALKTAQAALVVSLHGGVKLFPVINDDRVLIRQKLGPIEREWARPVSGASSGSGPTLPLIDALLSDLLSNGNQFGIRTVRV